MVTSEWMGGTKLRTFVRGVSRVGTLCGLVAGLAFYTSCVTPVEPDCATDADCDNGDFCDGAETCDVDSGDCMDGTAPCTDPEVCNEETDACDTVCDDDTPCEDDGDDCTDVACTDGVCVTSNNTADCDDGDVCTDGDVCAEGACAGAAIDGCCEVDADCADGEVCTDNACAAGGCADDADCDDGVLCNGSETCDLDTGDCVAGTDLCAEGQDCDEATGDCTTPCADAAECDDGNECTDDDCVDGVCASTDNAADCDDFDACTSGDVCAAGVCAGTDDVTCCEVDDDCDTGAGEVCANIDVDTGLGTCTGGCVEDADCDDGDPCTTNACVDGGCVPTDVDVDNGVFCDGVETCDSATGDAVDGDDPCDPVLESCNETDGVCDTVCTDDAGCDDGLFCNGSETCANIDPDTLNGTCAVGTDPCAADQTCDEVDLCVGFTVCDDTTLTTGTDNLTCGSGDETFDAALFLTTGGNFVQTLNNADSIDGGTGTNTLNAQFVGGGTTAPGGLNNLQILGLEVTDGNNTTLNAINADSVTTINNNNSQADLTVSNLSTAPGTLSMGNTGQNFTVTTTNDALSGTADAVTITLSGVIDAAGGEPVITVQPTSAASGYESITIDSSGGIANSIDDIVDGNGTSFVTLNLGGNQDLTIRDALGVGVTTVNAAQASGKINVTLGANNTTVTGGSGDDTLNFAGNWDTNDTVDGGGGTDTLDSNSADLVGTTSAIGAAIITGIDIISVNDALAGDLNVVHYGATGAKLAGIDGTSRTITVDESTGSVELTANAGNAAHEITASGNDDDDTLSIILNNADFANNLVLTDWETVNMESKGAGATNTIAGTTALPNSFAQEKLVITGSSNLTFTGAVTADLIDASAFTGVLTVGSTTDTGQILGGTGNDVLTASASADSVQGNDGNDTLTGGGGIDSLTGGGGTDIFFLDQANSLANLLAARNVIADFVAGSDDLTVNNAGGTANVGVLTGSDAFATAAAIVDHSTSGNLTVGGVPRLVRITVENATSFSTDGATVLDALVSGGGSGTIATANNAVVLFSVYNGTDTAVYMGAADTGGGGNGAIVQAELALVATFSNFNHADWTFNDINP